MFILWISFFLNRQGKFQFDFKHGKTLDQSFLDVTHKRVSIYTPNVVFYQEKWTDLVIQTNFSQQCGIWALPSDFLLTMFSLS